MTDGIVARRFHDPARFADVALFELAVPGGIRFRMMEIGATILSIEIPDRNGGFVDVVAGFDDLAGYATHNDYFGAIIGRVAGRIRQGQLSLPHGDHSLSVNAPPHHLHGGCESFDRKRWHGTMIDGGVRFELESPDGDEGYPGALSVAVEWTLAAPGHLAMRWSATTTAETAVDLTHHGYFNLAGHGAGSIADHHLAIEADHYLPLDDGGIATGERLEVAGTSFDFRKPRLIGSILAADDPQIIGVGGIDHCWQPARGSGLRRMATLSHEASRRRLDIWSDRPALQIYTGNALRDDVPGKRAVHYGAHSFIAFEPQYPPAALNRLHEPKPWLAAGQVARGAMAFDFSW